MALIIGTNCGFVSTAPEVDPAAASFTIDDRAGALKDTSPATAGKITEIGWWCDEATEESNFEVGIYTHDIGNNKPDVVVGSLSQTNAKGTDAGWKRVTGLNISITPATVYWIAMQLDNTTSITHTDSDTAGGTRIAYNESATTLTDPWSHTGAFEGWKFAFYAVWEAAAAPEATDNMTIIGENVY